MDEKIIAYMQKKLDYLLESVIDATLELSSKRESGVKSTYDILNSALERDSKFREEFKKRIYGGQTLKILNLYAGIGGNRKLWGGQHEITAVELDENIAEVYQDHYPNDTVIVGDAHQFLLDYYKEFDFIWSSPPCQSHSSFRQNIGVRYRGVKPVYPDMKLYKEIIFLQHNFNGKYVVENVNPYYKPLIEPSVKLDRHLFWTNFDIPQTEFDRPKIRSAQIPQLQEFLGYDLSEYKLPNKRQVLRNCVNPQVGKHILDAALEDVKECEHV